jgi:tetraacyldisaccharide 4'-kinase
MAPTPRSSAPNSATEMTSSLEASWYGKPKGWLAPLSYLYGAAMAVRRVLYRLRLRHRVRVKVPVIVIGNLTVGGTGKTPLVAWASVKLAALGHRVGVVSRGYGGSVTGVARVTPHSDPREVGDEPVVLARRAQAMVFVGRERAAAAQAAVRDGCDVILSDDGLQHLALERDCEIVVIDSDRGFGNGHLLPRGPLRERPGRLARVDALVVNGEGSQVPPITSTALKVTMRMAPGDAHAVAHGGAVRSLASFRGSPVHAVAAIGNPQRFFATLRGAGLEIVEHAFPDHHAYQDTDLRFADNWPVLMTEKDAVKCAGFAEPRCWFVPVTAEFSELEARALLDLIIARIKRASKSG